MFRPPETCKADPELEARLRESFVRLRNRGNDETAEPEVAADAAEIREPSLPAKLFIGPNATWYDDCWRWMEWRGRTRSWNWAAATTFGTWFGYRRMYGWQLAHGAAILSALTLVLAGVTVFIPIALVIVVSLLAGLYGNHLYLAHFRRKASRIARDHDQHEAQVKAVSEAGGVDHRMAWLWPAIMLVTAALIGSLMGFGPQIVISS